MFNFFKNLSKGIADEVEKSRFKDTDDLKNWDWESKEREPLELEEKQDLSTEKPTSGWFGISSNDPKKIEDKKPINKPRKYVINMSSINSTLQHKYEFSHDRYTLNVIDAKTVITNWAISNLQIAAQLILLPFYCCYLSINMCKEEGLCECKKDANTESTESTEAIQPSASDSCRKVLCHILECVAFPLISFYDWIMANWIFIIPYILFLMWLLSTFGLIAADINAMDSVIPFIGLLFFGQSIVKQHAKNGYCCIKIDCDFGCGWADSKLFDKDNVRDKLNRMKFLMGDGEWKTLFFLGAVCDNNHSKNNQYRKLGRYFVSFLFGMISILVRTVFRKASFVECGGVCIFSLVMGALFNIVIMNHVLLHIVQEFFDALKWFGHKMKQLADVLVFNFGTDRVGEDFLFLYEAENTPKWFEIWNVIQLQGRRHFKELETNLLGIVVSTFGASTILVYQYVFGYYTTELTVGMLYIWIVFLLILLSIVKYSKHFDEIQDKQLSSLSTQSQYINNLMFQIQLNYYSQGVNVFDTVNNKIIYYQNIVHLVKSYQDQIAKRTLSPTIMGLKFDKLCYRFFIFFVVSIVPGLFNLFTSSA